MPTKAVKKYADDDGLHDEIAELKGNGIGPLLKFDGNTKKYTIGEDEIPLDREYIAHIGNYARGWTKLVDKNPVAMHIMCVSEGKPPARDELDDIELAGTENDTWVFQRYLPLEDFETGSLVVFVSKSVGGKIALGELLESYEMGRARGLPIVKLAVSSFNTKAYGKRPRPDFKIAGWQEAGKALAPPAKALSHAPADDSDLGPEPPPHSNDDDFPF